jgi:hypothetical protein
MFAYVLFICQCQALSIAYDGVEKSLLVRPSGEPRIMSRAGAGVQEFCNCLKMLDSGFRRNDGKINLAAFYEFIKLDLTVVLSYCK